MTALTTKLSVSTSGVSSLAGPCPPDEDRSGPGSSGPADAERWRVDPASASPVPEWEGVLAATHVSFDVKLPDSGRFAGHVERRHLGALDLVECTCAPFAGRRTSAVMGDPGEDHIGLQMVLHGSEKVIRSRTEEHVLQAGSVGLWDGSRAVGVEVVEPFSKRTLIFPRELVHSVSPRLADVGSVSALETRPGARLLVRYVDALADELPALDERTGAAAADVVLELLRAVVEPGMPETREARREALRARVRRFVRVNLPDPGLGPESIARALAVSVRTLHSAFEDSGESVAALVRRTRLARCREDLEEPTAGSVTEIAFRWGFSDATHFSHVFKREYGMSPRDVRRAAREAVPTR
ncbi:helix-turn-helix domain-containing protein [Pseudonocardia benzenivorans]|uniref:Transcriptional regulator, AraC family n=1 Tax=Pseudonocardia dioxanivorans (strain ATCC 55486 / DSM 44775 / JCM 13855 / CB1190) TaxID=675635 RepID=F4CJM3_PSEUX|nr:helix-turn-helix domain-containing protein [Pseudonocardia dioxanivorans]AEA25883.1 transcriptional regulator, AraC family [Pseudonocardia dioxanivorans CB1190]GJF06357.1 AraC family transcriptional regulator [Pseudonocardia sp. D17]